MSIRSLETSVSPRAISWHKTDEYLKWETDYKVIYTRRRGRSRTGVMPVNVVWAWIPALTNYFIYRLAERIQTIIADDPSKSLVVILPPGVKWTDLLGLEPRIDYIWELQPQVMQGEMGPYPSLRAEMSIKRTFDKYDLNMVYHFWPSASLDPMGYMPIGTDEEIAKAWAQFSRANIPVQINKESK